MESLKAYQQKSHKQLREMLREDKPITDILNEMFTVLIEETTLDTTNKGCFIVNTTTEMANHDSEICELVSENRKEVENIFLEALEKAEQKGELKKEQESAALAHYFFNVYNGLRVVAKTDPTKEILEDIVSISISVFNNADSNL